MEEYFSALPACSLFWGIEPGRIRAALDCLSPIASTVPKGAAIFHEGDSVRYVGLILSGNVQLTRTDHAGKRTVMMSAGPGTLLGDTYLCAGIDQAPATAAAAQDSVVLSFDGHKLLTICENNCSIHRQIIRNLMRSVAQKNLALNQKIYLMSRRTTREKLMEFLSEQARHQGAAEFRILYDRQSLADYLGVERSAMSAEIGKLKKDGIIDCKGSWFRLNELTNQDKGAKQVWHS